MEKYQIDFVNLMAPIAVRQAAKHNNALFPSVTIGQAIQETGWGKNPTMMGHNAPFGVKVGKSAYKFGTAWKGASYNSRTTEYYDGKNATPIRDNFRAFDSLEDATEDYMDMLCTCKRYKAALNCRTPEESIRAIRMGGYATGPAYDKHVLDKIVTANLQIYDTHGAILVPTEDYVPGMTYTTTSDLYVRDGADGNKITFDKLTDNAKEHAKKDLMGYAILKKGTRVTCKNLVILPKTTWMHIPSGWICAKNSKNTYIV